MRVGDVIEQVALEIGEDVADFDIQFVLIKWTNEVVSEIYDAADWGFARDVYPIETAVGVSSYALPSNTAAVPTLVNPVTGRHLRMDHPASLARTGVPLSSTGLPVRYFLRGLDENSDYSFIIQLVPVPSAVETLYAVRRIAAPELVASSDTIPLPAVFHRLVIDGVRSKADTGEGAIRARTMFSIGLADLRARFELSPELYMGVGDRLTSDFGGGGDPVPAWPTTPLGQ